MHRKVLHYLCLKSQIHIGDSLIKKAQQSLLHSCVMNTVEPAVDTFQAYQTQLPFMSYLMMMECVFLNGWIKNICKTVFIWILLAWIQCSKKNKKSFFYELDEFHVHLEYMKNGITFQCHPNYKSGGEWYDWVMVQFDTGAHKDSQGKKQVGM